MNPYRAFVSSGLVLTVMLSVAGCAPQGAGSIESTKVTNHISNTTSNTPQNVASNGTDNTVINSNHAPSQPSKTDSLHMVSSKTGWDFAEVPGDTFGVVLRTVDGGQTWNDVTPPQLMNKQSTFAGGLSLNANDAWFVSGPSMTRGDASVFRTSDGGKTWSKVKLARNYEMTWISFVSPRTGWILASRGAALGMEPSDLYYTKNGGITWSKIDGAEGNLPLSKVKTGLSFENVKTGWMTIDNEVQFGRVSLFVTRDGGYTWAPESLSVPSQIQNHHYAHPKAPVFSSATDGVLPVYFDGGTQSILYFTTDGGETWVPSSPVNLKKISHVAVANQGTIWVTDGHSLYVTTTSGHSWRNLSSGISGESDIIGLYTASDSTSAIVFTLTNGKVRSHQINDDG